MITLVQISCAWARSLGFKVIGAYDLYGNFYGRLYGYTFPKVILWDEPSGFQYKCRSTSDKWWYALIFFIFFNIIYYFGRPVLINSNLWAKYGL